MSIQPLLIFGIVCLTLSGCRDDEPKPDLSPETYISVSEINRSGDDRLISRVKLSWYGTDVDGYVAAYELSVNESAFTRVTTQDSTFVFNIIPGTDSADVSFRVRAIDNNGNVDRSPAFLLIPVKNTPPNSSYSAELFIPDTVRLVPTFGFAFEDVDGIGTVDSLFVRFNNGNWFGISSRAASATFLPSDPSASGSVTAKVYMDERETPLPGLIDGLLLDGSNEVYFRVKDVANAFSETDTISIFIKNKKNDLLVLDSYGSSSSTVPNPEQLYFGALTAAGQTFDYSDLLQDYNATDGFPYLTGLQRLGFKLMVKQYATLFWYSDSQKFIGRKVDNSGGRHLLEQASDALQNFLNGGGKVFIASAFKDIGNNSSLFQYTPAMGFPTDVTSRRIIPNFKAYPGFKFRTDFDTLTFQNFQLGASPFFVKPTADTLYTSDIRIGITVSREVVAAVSRTGVGNINMVFWSIELHKYSADLPAFNAMFSEVFLNEFNW